MENSSRTKNSLRNILYSMIYMVVNIVLEFILRTIFIRSLGKSYLGLNGLFSNILSILSLMDVGIGNAIIVSLYKPLAREDLESVASLMAFYKKVYFFIGILVCGVGCALVPFLNLLVNLPNDVDGIYFIYLLFVANTGVKYFLTYKKTLLNANQRSDIASKNDILFRCIRFVFLLFILLFLKNYILYLSLDVIITIVSGVRIVYLINKKYPFLKTIKAKPLVKEEKRSIIRFTRAGLISKIGQTVVTSTDNILISIAVGTIYVGMYSNYTMIISNVECLVYLVFSGLTASIGNFAVTSDGLQLEKLFNKSFFACFVMVFFFSVCMFALINPFIFLWAGADYVLDQMSVIIILVNFYIATLHHFVENFINVNGELYYKSRFMPLTEAVVNLASSIVFVEVFGLGLCGVFLGTTLCFLCGRVWMDVRIIYKYWFNKSFINYIFKYSINFILTVMCAVGVKLLCDFLFNILGITLLSWIVCSVISTGLCGIFIFICFRKTEYYSFFKNLVKSKIIKMSRRNAK